MAGVPSLGQQEHTGIHYYGTLRVQRDINDVLLMKVTIVTTFFLVSPFIVPPVLLQTISTLRSLVNGL